MTIILRPSSLYRAKDGSCKVGIIQLFSAEESEYLKSQRLARVATASKTGVPEVSPVGFEFDGKYFWIGSHSQDILPKTRRYKNIISGNSRISLVVDDLVSINPWRPRGIKFEVLLK